MSVFMTDILSFVFSLFAVLFVIDASLYRYSGAKRGGDAGKTGKAVKEYIIIYVVIVLLFAGWVFFFKDRSLYIECRQDTLTCSYFHTTQFNKNMRLVKNYDISRVSHAQVKKHYRKRGTTYYTVLLSEDGENGFLLPPHFGYSDAAKTEADRFNRFLAYKKDFYIYKELPSGDFPELVLFISILMALFLEFRLFWHLVEEVLKERKKEKKRKGKENAPPRDGVIQRKR